VTNTATALSDENPAGVTASDATDVTVSADLAVSVTDGLATVVAGTGGHAYTITITNSGPSDADTVVLDDVLPAAFTAGTPSADLGGDCSTSSGNTIACTLPASLAPGATWTITIPYAVGAAVTAQTVTNTATALSDENPAGVTASDATDVTAMPAPTPTPTPNPTPTPRPTPRPTPHIGGSGDPTPSPSTPATPAPSDYPSATQSPNPTPRPTTAPQPSPTEGPDSTHVGATDGPTDQVPLGALLIVGSLAGAVLILLFGIGRRRRRQAVSRIARRS
jgi:uncharacterized repeat protein (TIGR01451 family)